MDEDDDAEAEEEDDDEEADHGGRRSGTLPSTSHNQPMQHDRQPVVFAVASCSSIEHCPIHVFVKKFQTGPVMNHC